MTETKQLSDAFYEGLKALEDHAFPKPCERCGKTYEGLQDYLARTEPPYNETGLTELEDGEKDLVVGLWRKCACDAVLVQGFKDRRDMSEKGVETRQEFGQLVAMLSEFGIEEDAAREELIKILHGQKSAKLDDIGFDIRKIG